jgi:hypothetical protein
MYETVFSDIHNVRELVRVSGHGSGSVEVLKRSAHKCAHMPVSATAIVHSVVVLRMASDEQKAV